MCAPQARHGSVAEDMTRTDKHGGDLGGVPARDFPVEARGALEHCGEIATKELRTSRPLLKSYATMCALQPWHGTVAEEASRTGIHAEDLGGVPRRDIPVEAPGVPKHCGKSNERTENISYSSHHDRC